MNANLSKNPHDALIRTFLAVELPRPCKTRLASLEGEFAGLAPILKWVPSDLVHITVKFLGGVPQSRLAIVEEGAAAAASRVQPFSLQLSGLGAFPNERAPRVIWVGLAVDRGYEALRHLFQNVEDELAIRGFEREERRYSPHLTLARTRDQVAPAERRRLGETLSGVQTWYRTNERFEVGALVVMRSDLARSGPIYTPLATLPLGASTT